MLALAVLLALPCFTYSDGFDTPPEAESVEAAAESPERVAESLWQSIRFEASGHSDLYNKLLYNSLSKPETFAPYEQFSMHWDESVPAHWLCVQWNAIPEGVHLIQLDRNGNILAKTRAAEEFDTVLELESSTGCVTFSADRRGMEIAGITLFSEGTLPEPFMPWQPPAGHLDYLIVATHPDDDVLFMGGIAPIYGAERGFVGTVAYVTNPGRLRINEAMKGAWAMGIRHRPQVIGFRDMNGSRYKEGISKFLPEAVTLAIVRLIREQRPLVVFTHDVNGEYGHWQHIVVSAATLEACKLAVDENYDPDSVTAFGTWEVKKCYLHLFPENTLALDVETPLASMDGRTAIEVAQEAFLKHKTQQNGHHWVQTNKDAYPLSQFGMAYGTVEAGTDAFDNIDPALFVSALSDSSSASE